MITSSTRHPGTRTSALVLGVVGTVLAATLAAPAGATPTDTTTARAQAAAIATEVEDLRTRSAVATERYNAVRERLASVAAESISTSAHIDTLANVDDANRDAATRRVSAIYRSGGGLSLYATVLDGGTPNDVMNRMRTVQSLVDDDVQRGLDLDDAMRAAENSKARLTELTRSRLSLIAEADAARDTINDLLDRQSAALDSANATVARLVEEEQARRTSTAEAAAVVALGDVGDLLGDEAPGSPYAAAAIAAAQTKLGLPYLWGGTGPNAYDCSGLVQWAYREAGLSIMRVAADQFRSGPQVELSAIAPGDLVFWSKNPANKPGIHHVAMYVGKGMMIEAPYTGAVIRVVPLRLGPEFAGAVRPGLAR